MNKNKIQKVLLYLDDSFEKLSILESVLYMTLNYCLNSENSQKLICTNIASEKSNCINMLTIALEKISCIKDSNESIERELLQ